jgi:hypothetical protein
VDFAVALAGFAVALAGFADFAAAVPFPGFAAWADADFGGFAGVAAFVVLVVFVAFALPAGAAALFVPAIDE